jgi:hypothetical protein
LGHPSFIRETVARSSTPDTSGILVNSILALFSAAIIATKADAPAHATPFYVVERQ